MMPRHSWKHQKKKKKKGFVWSFVVHGNKYLRNANGYLQFEFELIMVIGWLRELFSYLSPVTLLKFIFLFIFSQMKNKLIY